VPGEQSDVPAEVPPATTDPLAESSLPEGAERYASLFSHHPHATYSVDRRGYYTDANRLALEMTGLSLEQMRQTHFTQVIHPEDVHLLQEAFDVVLTGTPQVVDARVLRADGEVVDIRCTAIPDVVGGEVVGVHGITEDTTAARRVLRELHEANLAKTRFLATVSHEVRTPLAALIGATELLMEAELQPESAHLAQIVHRSTERLMRLTQDVLEFSGLEAHGAVLRRAPVHVRDLVDDVADWVAPLVEGRDVEVSFDVDAAVPSPGIGDAPRIAQVVRTLVHNAVTYTERGRVDVRVTCPRPPDHPVVEGDTWVEFEVTDTGRGIAADQLPTLFEPFTRADPHSSGDRRGNGLGLAIASELAELMHGRLGVVSVLGEGSTFTFGAPLGRVDRVGSDR
jgi:PAS domain S-box-containing protein